MNSSNRKLTKSVVDNATPRASRYVLWDGDLKGFGLRIEPSGRKTYILRYRPKGAGRAGAKRYLTIGRHGVLTPEQARNSARISLGNVAEGSDPAAEHATQTARPTLTVVFDAFMDLHAEPKLKPGSASAIRTTFRKHILPAHGKSVAEDLRKIDVAKLHAGMRATPFAANRAVDYLSSVYAWAGENGLVAESVNPTRGIERYAEDKRERFLNVDEMVRLGSAIREAETVGVPWIVDEDGPKSKHLPKGERRTRVSPEATAALRLLLFTGARLREVLHLRWEHVDVERAALFLPDSKTGRKTIYLNPMALSVLGALPRSGDFVFPGANSPDGKERPRWDLRRPWGAIRRHADLQDVRLHDLRHTHASFGVGGGLGLPIIAKLLGHGTTRMTERYAHLDADPIRRASEAIGNRIADALGEGSSKRRSQ